MMANNEMGRSRLTANGVFQTEAIGQHAIRVIANLCFALFVVGVLIFTVLAATYEPEDPWLRPSEKITTFLTSTANATFASDESVLRTGEDFGMSTTGVVTIKPINASELDSFQQVSQDSEATCDSNGPSIPCSEDGVLGAIMEFAIKNFEDIKFYRFGRPVAGSNESSCDVSWRFQPRNGKSAVFYKDYRRFFLKRSDLFPCNYTVVSVGEWHSGKNARRKKQKPGFEPERVKVLPPVATVGEIVNDSIPVLKSEDAFTMGKYLLYSRGGDYCKGMSQYLWSFLCALGEAQYLQRTFVMDLDVCLSGSNNPGHQDEGGKDFRFYFDFEHLKESASVIEQSQFWQDWKKWKHRDGLTLTAIDDIRTTPMQLKEDQSTLIWRRFGTVEPDNYWYRVCEGETEKVIQRPWHLIWKSKRLMEIVSAISTRLNWDFDTVHVVRGEKAKNRDLWPNLALDTSPETLLEKLRPKIEEGRNIYIATNEMESGFFDPLKETYKLHFLDDFSDLWGENSEWYAETLALNNGKPVEFDGYMRVEVDTEVFFRGKTQIETFNDLTRDCKDGVGTCSS